MVHPVIYLKENYSKIWEIIEYTNGVIFKFLFSERISRVNSNLLKDLNFPPYSFRKLKHDDLKQVILLISYLEPDQRTYFEPHGFDLKSLEKILRNPSFYMMGVFLNSHLVGYFFLRCFFNKKCFVGRLVQKEYRGLGIGKKMNDIMYKTAWDSDFKCYATISQDNALVMNAHAKNTTIVICKQLKNNYLLVEFVNNI